VLDSFCVADCNLMTLYLIACNLNANMYNVTMLSIEKLLCSSPVEGHNASLKWS
jgi:hypothetical protein